MAAQYLDVASSKSAPRHHIPKCNRAERRRKVAFTIGVVTMYAAFYQISPSIGVAPVFIIALYLLSPFVVPYMAYVILKYGEPSGYTFEERLYDDHNPKGGGSDE